jgi:hypothetical protein
MKKIKNRAGNFKLGVELAVRVTVFVQEKEREERASLVTRTEKLSLRQSDASRYLQAPWKLKTRPSKVR